MKIWQVHSGPYDDDEGKWWLVVKAEVDEVVGDFEVMFSTMDDALKFKEKLMNEFEPIEIKEGY